MDERHLRVVEQDGATGDGDATIDLSGTEPVVDVTPEENPWVAGRERMTHPSLQDRAPRKPEIRPTIGRDDRIRAYLRLVDGT
jgi:hypothetical protein